MTEQEVADEFRPLPASGTGSADRGRLFDNAFHGGKGPLQDSTSTAARLLPNSRPLLLIDIQSSNVSDTVDYRSRCRGIGRQLEASRSMVTNVLYLGRVAYGTALDLQRTLLEMRKSARIENTLLLLEHPPVITLGRNAHLANVLAPPEFLAQQGVELFDIDRGGDVTYHGPGQLIAYPIFDLRSFEPRSARWNTSAAWKKC